LGFGLRPEASFALGQSPKLASSESFANCSGFCLGFCSGFCLGFCSGFCSGCGFWVSTHHIYIFRTRRDFLSDASLRRLDPRQLSFYDTPGLVLLEDLLSDGPYYANRLFRF
jgi:hypothetical protein